MKSLAFGDAIRTIVERLRLTELETFLAPYFKRGNFSITAEAKNQFSTLAFDLHNAAQDLLRSHDTAVVLEKLGLKELLTQAELATAITFFRNATQRNQVTAQEIFWFLYYQTLAAIRLNYAVQELIVAPKLKELPQGRALLPIDIIDYDDSGVELERLILILSSLARLYRSFEEVAGEPQSTPRLLFADSGTDIKLGLEGVGETIDAIRRCFQDAWNALRYRKNRDFTENLASVAAGVQAIADVRRRVASGDLDNEAGLRLEHAIKQDLDRLIGAGAMIADIEVEEAFDRRAILTAARDTKLLAPPSPIAEDGTAASEPTVEDPSVG